MIVHRFMSEAEYECLLAGGKLINATRHKEERGKRTTSVGFCFFTEDPDEAIHWLSGCTCPEMCVTMDVPDGLLTESSGTYRDSCSPFGSPAIERREYCTTEYSLSRGVKILSSTDRFREYADIYRALVACGVIRP